MEGKTKLPTGIENFMEMRTGGFYYVDKTGLIKTLLENPGKVNLFTRPRRFGKTLNMSMLRYFFKRAATFSRLITPRLLPGLRYQGKKNYVKSTWGNFLRFQLR